MSQEDFKIRSIKPVFINPSIMEGEILYTSILGPDAAVPIDRYPPVNLIAPQVSGSFKIPSTLTMSNGVWDGSPSPYFEYQWFADDVAIPGATGKTFITYAELDGKQISGEVTGISNLGSVVAVTSNFLTVSLLLPVIVQEFETNIITGMNQENAQNLLDINYNVATGMWVDTRLDTSGYSGFITTGMWVDTRFDISGYSNFAIQGLQSEGQQEVYVIEAAAIEFYDPLATIATFDFEDRSLADWIISPDPAGNSNARFRIRTNYAHTGTACLQGPANTGNFIASTLVPIPSEYWDEVDAKIIAANYDAYVSITVLSYGWEVDGYHFSLTFLNASNNEISHPHTEPVTYTSPTQNVWQKSSMPPCVVPVGTRTIKVNVHMTSSIFGGTDCCVDDLSVNLYTSVHK